MKAVKGCITSTRNAVESAIDATKGNKNEPWAAIAKRLRISRWTPQTEAPEGAKAVRAVKDRCSDPYAAGCYAIADGFIIGQQYRLSGDGFVSVRINLCKTCTWWNSDWDWDQSPDGPTIRESAICEEAERRKERGK